MIKILAIGNSFSADATRYLQEIAKADGVAMKVVNLYIGGCSLRTHYINALQNRAQYMMEFNGVSTGFYVSIQDALISDEWDIVTLQQVSHQSGDYESYRPYLKFLADYVRKYAPKSKIYIHQTWAYEADSLKLKYAGYETPADMFFALQSAYKQAARAIEADGIIPSGEMMMLLVQNGIRQVHRDTFHASKGIGRYALALLWYRILTNRSVLDNCFCDFDEEISARDLQIIRKTVESVQLQ